MVDKVSQPMRRMTRSATESSRKMDRVADTARKAGRSMNRMGGAASGAGSNLRRLGRDADHADRKLHRLARNMRNMQTVRLGMGGALTGLGAGLLTRRVGSTLIDYEKAMNMVAANVFSHTDKTTGELIFKGFENAKSPILESAKAMGALRKETQRIAQVSIFDPTQVAGGLLELARAGFTVQEQLTALHPVMRLASAGNLDPKQALDIATNINTAFGKDIAHTATTADYLAMAASNANTTVAQLGQAMKYAAPSAVTAGRSMQETTSVLMSLAKRGLKDSIGGTSVARMLESVYKRSGPAVKALKSIGLAHKDFMGADGKTIPIADMLEKFQIAAKKFGKEKVIMAIQAMMGSRGGRAAKLLYEAADEIRANEKLLQSAINRAKMMEKVMMSGVYGAYEKMRSSLYESIISLGEGGFSKDLEGIATKIKELANSFSELSPTTKKWIGRLLLAATVISAIIIPLGIFMWALGALVPVITLIGGALALLLSPIGLITAGVIALGAALTSVFAKHWGGSQLQSLFQSLQSQMGALSESVLNFLATDNPIANVFKTALNYATQLVGVISKIPSYIMNPMKAAKDFAKFNHDTAQGVGDKAASFTKKIGSWLPDLSVSKSPKEVITGKTIAKSQADKEMSLKVQTDNQVTIDAPGTIILKLPDGTVAGSIPLKGSVVSKGITTPDAVGP